MWLLHCGGMFSQNNKPYEIGIVLENDSFTSVTNDKYYTNGTEVFYQHLSDESNKAVKKIISFKAGQYIYNPEWVKSDFKEFHNRPYAGYLFTELGIRRFYENESIWITDFQLGMVGPLAQADDLQKKIHAVFGFRETYGWQHQIGNAIGVQYNSLFSKKISQQMTTDKMDCHFQLKIDLGTIFTGFSLGSLMRFSLIKPIVSLQHSNFYGASLQKGIKTDKELYVFILPKINCQIYDATIQGSLFENNSPLVFNIRPFRFKAEAGIKFRSNNWNLSYSLLYTTDEIKNSTTSGFYYGSITTSYLFLNKKGVKKEL